MKTYLKFLIAACLVLGLFLGSFGSVRAMIPSLMMSSTTNGIVLISVTGDNNSTATLYYSTYSGLQSRVLGNSNYYGFLSTTIDTRSYGITSGSSAYVIINGQRSSYVTWPYIYPYPSYLTLSQTNVSLSVGQTSTVIAYGTIGSLYISNNSNSTVATASIIGNTISVYGNQAGNTTITVCQYNYGSSCAMLYVTVAGGYYPPYYPQNNNGGRCQVPLR